jgi:serine/threonine protein kinase
MCTHDSSADDATRYAMHCVHQPLQVLTLNGYGREADIWSVGTIMYLLMRGRLPFDGDSREEIIERTINGSIDTDDEIWRTYSAEAKELLLGLLNKVHTLMLLLLMLYIAYLHVHY